MDASFTVTLNGTAGIVSPNLLCTNGNIITGYDGIRAKALYKIIQTLQEVIGNFVFTTELNQYVSIFDRVCNEYKQGDWSDYSGMPNMPDFAPYEATDQTNRDPFAPPFANPLWITRSSYIDVGNIISNTPTQAVVQVNLSAPIPLSPLAFGEQNRRVSMELIK